MSLSGVRKNDPLLAITGAAADKAKKAGDKAADQIDQDNANFVTCKAKSEQPIRASHNIINVPIEVPTQIQVGGAHVSIGATISVGLLLPISEEDTVCLNHDDKRRLTDLTQSLRSETTLATHVQEGDGSSFNIGDTRVTPYYKETRGPITPEGGYQGPQREGGVEFSVGDRISRARIPEGPSSSSQLPPVVPPTTEKK